MTGAKNKKNEKSTKCRRKGGGYTVIELIVSVGLFSAIVLLASSAFFGVVSSNRKTLAVRSAMDNLNFAVESMSRDMKTGFTYHCGAFGLIDAAQDCIDGASYISFEGQYGDMTTPDDQIVYRRGDPSFPNCPSPQQICRSVFGGAADSFLAITAPPPELSITGLAFRVYGSREGFTSDVDQPRVTIVIIGTAGAGVAASTFDIQTTVSQRLPDT